MTTLLRRELLKYSASTLLAILLASSGRVAHADATAGLELSQLSLLRNDDGVLLTYDVRFDLPSDIELALNKGLAVTFVARADLMRARWYWKDQVKASVQRRWRLAYLPLTRHWRVNFDGLSRQYTRLNDALDAMRRAYRWRIADPLSANDDQEYYLSFSFKLDTDELPRPLQIGLGGQPDWNVAVEKRVTLPPPSH